MFQALQQKTIFPLKIAVIATLLFMSIFGLWHSFLMPMDASGSMVGCPLMGESSALCQMSATEHIQAWQAMFTAIPQKTFGSLLTLLLLAVVILFTLTIYRLWHLSRLRLFAFYKLYVREHPHLSFFSHLKEAFSQGILNPRIYA